MSHHRTTPSALPQAPAPVDIAFWRQRVKDLPDLRWDKVTDLRNAIRANQYQIDHHLDEVLKRIEDEVSALCAEEVDGVDLDFDD
jgi:hypothetical protein